MTILWIIFLAIIGAAMGSFIGAMTWRMRKKMDWVKGRSECEKCHHQLNAIDMFPVFSWLFLRGKCRYCGTKIGWTTFILEFGVAAAFVVSFLAWPGVFSVESFTELDVAQITSFVLWLVAVVLMSALLVYDARWKLLPNKLMFPLIGVALAMAALNVFITDESIWSYLANIGLAFIPVFGVYLFLYLISNGKWVGFGDVRFGVVVALMLADWQKALLVLVMANLIGTLIILPGLLTGKLKRTSKIPFGPMLIAATFVTILWGQNIIDFVTKKLLLL